MENTAIIVLAAGKGTRMASKIPKVLTRTSEDTLLGHVLRNLAPIESTQIVVVTGYERQQVEHHVSARLEEFDIGPSQLAFAFQSEQKGTGHAVSVALKSLGDFSGRVLIVYGDMPLLSAQTLESMLIQHEASEATLSICTCEVDVTNHFGRIRRDPQSNQVLGIVEFKDASPAEQFLREGNVGVYVVDSAFLTPAIESLEPHNAQSELYLTDIVAKAASEGQNVVTYTIPNKVESLGVNTRADLALIDEQLRAMRIKRLVESGVEIPLPNTVLIGSDVQIESGAYIGPNVSLMGQTSIGAKVVIEGDAFLKDVEVSENTILRFGVRAEQAVIGPGCAVGPFAHLRPGTVLEGDVKIGNFVETKKALLARGSKASHLTYLGDCEVGEDANVGAGTITCNYDGHGKHKTTIEKGAFIGSNTALVAPVTVGEGAYVGAGSTITKDVPAKALGLARAEQRNIPGWANRFK
jgi:bifunctional UDP-N-acetylglucosamine pyrophosphorylase / glucosamine-1-phosphate N-acetyltransferase